MPAIPTSDMQGHQALHNRVLAALDRCVESQGVDFKQSSAWEDLKFKIIRTALAMGNLRDGGVIVVGVSQNGDRWELPGISAEHLRTYDVDDVVAAVNRYSSPAMEPELVLVKHLNGNCFLAIRVIEFEDTPYVCRRDGPTDSGLKEGTLYLRPRGLARTSQVTSAVEMHDLLELAAEKRARRILEIARRVGFKAEEAGQAPFDREIEGL